MCDNLSGSSRCLDTDDAGPTLSSSVSVLFPLYQLNPTLNLIQPQHNPAPPPALLLVGVVAQVLGQHRRRVGIRDGQCLGQFHQPPLSVGDEAITHG